MDKKGEPISFRDYRGDFVVNQPPDDTTSGDVPYDLLYKILKRSTNSYKFVYTRTKEKVWTPTRPVQSEHRF